MATSNSGGGSAIWLKRHVRFRGPGDIPLTTDLVAWWELGESSGTRFDSTLNNLDLTDNNTVGQKPALSPALDGAAHFTLANDEYLSHADDPLLSTVGSFTFSAWVLADSLPAGAGSLAVIAGKWTGTGSPREWLLCYNKDTNNFLFETYETGGSVTGQAFATTLGAPSIDTWYHVVARYDSSAGTCSIQVDDGSEDSAALTGADPGDTAAVFQLGKAGTSASQWDGKISNAGYWSRVLSAQNVTDLYQGGYGLAYPFSTTLALTTSLEGFWALDETSGVRSDTSGNARDLTDFNTVTGAVGVSASTNLLAAQFTNANSEYLAGALGDFDPATKWMVSCWVYLDNKATTQFLIGKGAINQKFWHIRYDVGLDRFVFFTSPNAVINQSVTANNFGSPPIGTWLFLQAFHTSQGNTLVASEAYLSGIRVNDGKPDVIDTGSVGGHPAWGISLGGGVLGTNAYSDARMDASGVWSKDLTGPEWAHLYNGGLGKEYPF